MNAPKRNAGSHPFWDAVCHGLWLLVSGRPRLVVLAAVLLAAVSGWGAATHLHLNANQDHLVSPEVPFHKRYLNYLKNFGDQEYIYVVVQTGHTPEGLEQAKSFADDMAARLRSHPDQVESVSYRITPAGLGRGALLYADMDQVRQVAAMVEQLAPAVHAWLADPTLAVLTDQMAALLSGDSQAAGQGIDPTAGAELLPPALDRIGELVGSMRDELDGQQPETGALDLSQAGAEYFLTGENALLVMRVLPHKDFATLDVIGRSLSVIRSELDAVRAAHPEVEAGLTGRPVLQADEMDTTNADMTRASIIAVLIVGGLFVIVMHGFARAALVVFSLLLAMAWTYGFATVAVGSLNLLSIVFALVLVGIGADYGVHVIMRFVEDRSRGQTVPTAVENAIRETGPGIILGALTSVCAFYVVLGSDFTGLSELGLVGGTGILLCLVSMLTVLPALLLWTGRSKLLSRGGSRLLSLSFLEPVLRRPGLVLVLTAAVTLAGLPGLFKVHFSYNLLELQAKGLESVEYEMRLVNAEGESTWFAMLSAQTLDELREKTAKLAALDSVAGGGGVQSILDYIPADQQAKVEVLHRAARALGAIQVASEPDSVDPQALSTALESLQDALDDLAEKLFAAGAGNLLARLDALTASVDELRQELGSEPAKATQRLPALQASVRAELLASLELLHGWLGATSVQVQDLPAAITDLFVGRDGSYLIKVVPSQNVWNFDTLGEFVHELRSVDPLASGVPVGVYESARLMHHTFLTAAGWTLVLVCLILLVATRSVVQVLYTLLPLAVSLVWLLEAMGWLGVDFNLANFFAIPILIAIGVDGGVHLLHRVQALGGVRGLFTTSTPTATALSFATTMVGFGGLLLAHHRGLASLGYVMVLGSAAGLAACLLVLPAALTLAGYGGKQS